MIPARRILTPAVALVTFPEMICGWRLQVKYQIPNAIEGFLKSHFPSFLIVAEGMSEKKPGFRKDAIMLQPVTGSATCSECNASYESETKLREHQIMSHRGQGTEEKPETTEDITQSENPKVQIALHRRLTDCPEPDGRTSPQVARKKTRKLRNHQI
jgi:hypothetical protein